MTDLKPREERRYPRSERSSGRARRGWTVAHLCSDRSPGFHRHPTSVELADAIARRGEVVPIAQFDLGGMARSFGCLNSFLVKRANEFDEPQGTSSFGRGTFAQHWPRVGMAEGAIVLLGWGLRVRLAWGWICISRCYRTSADRPHPKQIVVRGSRSRRTQALGENPAYRCRRSCRQCPSTKRAWTPVTKLTRPSVY